MDDDWDDTPSIMPTPSTDIQDVDSGRLFGKGRGFMAPADDEGNQNGYFNGRGDFRGRGGRGNRGGNRGGFRERGGRGGSFNDDDGSDGARRGSGGFRGGHRRFNQESDDNDGDSPRRGGFSGRGRGGSGRGGGGFRDNDDDNNSRKEKNENGEGEKPREIYIPPEPAEDEESIFGAGISSGINFSKYDNIKIQVTGENVPKPISSFEDAGLRKYVLENIEKSGYNKPTPVQKYAIPVIMAGRDLMACAQTGSGKTAAFLLPIVNQLLQEPRDAVYDSSHAEPQAVIISPTRELAMQIYNEARKFSHTSILKSAIAYGGTSTGHQAQKLQFGCHILVATPGRLNDYVNRGRITFNSVRYFVLDEADRMLDQGFLPEVEKMLNHPTMVPTGDRQTLMFSATFPEDIQHFAAKFLNNYLFLTVGIVGGACADVEQRFYQISKYEKRDKLKELLEESGNERTLVFVETKRNADFIAIFLSEQKYPTTSIHGDRYQRERETALADFKAGRCSVMVATAVAARGLDIKGVSHVINYDLPKTIEEYVHRIGRTGRVGNRGKATSFYESGQDDALAKDLVKILQQAEQEVPSWLDGEGLTGTGGFTGSSYGGRDVRKFNKGGDAFGTMATQGLPQNIDDDDNWE